MSFVTSHYLFLFPKQGAPLSISGTTTSLIPLPLRYTESRDWVRPVERVHVTVVRRRFIQGSVVARRPRKTSPDFIC